MGLKKRQGRRKRKLKMDKMEDQGEDSARRVEDAVEEWKEMANAEERRVKLATKVNFRPFDEEEDFEEDDQEPNFRNFLPPRPLPGLRPWLCVLLAPRLDNCCSSSQQHIKRNQPERSRSPTVSIHSLHLPQLAKPSPNSRPHGCQAARWGGQRKPKLPIEPKILQAPPKLTIKLRGEVTPRSSPPNLLVEDRMFRLRRFLNLGDSSVDNGGLKSVEEVGSGGPATSRAPKKVKAPVKVYSRSEMQVICNKAQFFTRPGKPMR